MWSEQVLPVVLTSAVVHCTYMLMPRSFCEWPGLRRETMPWCLVLSALVCCYSHRSREDPELNYDTSTTAWHNYSNHPTGVGTFNNVPFGKHCIQATNTKGIHQNSHGSNWGYVITPHCNACTLHHHARAFIPVCKSLINPSRIRDEWRNGFPTYPARIFRVSITK